MRLSVVLATRNESANLPRCLESIKGLADEIVVADEKSTDGTVAIAKKYGARVLSVDHSDNFHITKNLAISAAKGDWILQLDADEVVTPELAAEIRSVLQPPGPSVNGYWLNRKNWFLDRFLTKGGQYPNPTLRLYKNGFGRLPAKDVHEQAVVDGKTGRLASDLLHYRDTSFAKYLDGFNRYSSFLAARLRDQKLPLNALTFSQYVLFKPAFTFLKIYFRHKGFVDGLPGFIFALFSGLIFPIAFIKCRFDFPQK